jgi:hypothetical protein
MGEARREALRVVFDRSIKLDFHGAKVTCDAGLLPYRELDGSLGPTAMAGNLLKDRRTGGFTADSAILAMIERSDAVEW